MHVEPKTSIAKRTNVNSLKPYSFFQSFKIFSKLLLKKKFCHFYDHLKTNKYSILCQKDAKNKSNSMAKLLAAPFNYYVQRSYTSKGYHYAFTFSRNMVRDFVQNLGPIGKVQICYYTISSFQA